MITSEVLPQRVELAVFGEFTLDDFQRFEELADYRLRFEGKIDLLIDLRSMSGFTLDVAWEEVRFSRMHAHDFRRIAVVTESQRDTWAAFVSQFFTEADICVFADDTAAREWLSDEAAE